LDPWTIAMKALVPLARLRLAAAALTCVASAAELPALGDIRVERLPDHGLQPKVVRTPDGTLHLVYLSGEDRAADVNYVRRPAGAKDWTVNLKVNSEPGSAIAVGTIRGADIAVGRDASVHVAWNGSGQARPKLEKSSPLLYSRLADGGARFEP